MLLLVNAACPIKALSAGESSDFPTAAPGVKKLKFMLGSGPCFTAKDEQV